MIAFRFENITASNREPYNNVAAHEELKSMMSRFDRLNIFFDIDEDGYEVIKVESTYVKRFAYQLNNESANWLMTYRKRLLNYILCIRFFIEVHSIVSASRFFHMPTYLRVVIECQSRFFPFFPAFSRNCPDYFLHTSGSSSFRSLSDLGAR